MVLFDFPLVLRGVLSGLSAVVLMLLMGPIFIRQLKKQAINQPIRDDGPAQHLSKAGTPTMGGVLVLCVITFATLLWGDVHNTYLWGVLLSLLGFGLLGFWDDWCKLSAKNSQGLSAKWKYLGQSVLALCVVGGLYLSADTPAQTHFFLPFFKSWGFDLGLWFWVLGYFVVVGTSNAVNLTDGLDGLAIFPTALIALVLGGVAYGMGDVSLAKHFSLPYIAHVRELLVFGCAVMGAGLGFLWFNSYPAQVFMGDVGSLGLGAALGVLAVMLRQEVLLVVIGGVFVIETLSVIIQVGSFKLRGKRVFRMAPIHHHFELKGWSEPKVVMRFWIVTIILIVLGVLGLLY